MNKRLILHIGAGKTGSSAIQAFLRKNRVALSRNNVAIPDHHLGTGSQISGNQVFKIQELLTDGDLAEALRLLMKSVDDDATVIVSAENLSNPGVHEHLRGLGAQFPVSAVLYIRRQDDLLASAWQQWHSKTNTDLQAWLLGGLAEYGNWADLAAEWSDILGDGNLVVRTFERSTLTEANVLVDFLDACGLAHLRSELDVESTGTVNPSHSDVITALVAGSPGVFDSAHDNEFSKMVEELTGDRYSTGKKVSLFSPAQREAILRHYAPQNEAIRQQFFPDRKQLFSPIKHDIYEYLTAAELQQRQMRFLAEMVTGLYRKIEASTSAGD